MHPLTHPAPASDLAAVARRALADDRTDPRLEITSSRTYGPHQLGFARLAHVGPRARKRVDYYAPREVRVYRVSGK